MKTLIEHKRLLLSFIMSLSFFILKMNIVLAQVSVGSSPSAFDSDARALSMGGAFVAIADNYASPYWNPAGMTQMRILGAGYAYTNKYGLDIVSQFLSGGGTLHVSLPFKITLRIAGGGSYIEQRIAGITLFGPDGEPMGTIDSIDSFLLGSIATGFEKEFLKLSVGYTLGRHSSQLGEQKGGGNSSGYGLLISLADTFSLGARYQKGASIAWTTGVVDSISDLYRIGVSLKLFNQALLFALQEDLTGRPEDWDLAAIRFGTEMIPNRLLSLPAFLSTLSLRSGFVWSIATTPPSLIITFGLGLRIFFITLDFAFVPHPDFGNSLLLSFNASF